MRTSLFCGCFAFLSTLSLRRATWQPAQRLHLDQIFLSTLSLRRATIVGGAGNNAIRISIHALLAESDTYGDGQNEQSHYFYPRSPCGERLVKNHIIFHHNLFLSTLSLRRATREPTALRTPHQRFLSTLSLRRATPKKKKSIRQVKHFYPRSPCGERPRLDVEY